MVQQAQRFRKSREDRLLFGVAGGVAEYFDVDPVLIRMGWILLAVATFGIALVLYVVLAIIVPKGRQSVSGDRPEGDASGDSPGSVIEADPDRGPTKRHAARSVLGIGMIVVGMIILLHQLDVIGAIRWDIVWPVGIVILGITILSPTIVTFISRLRTSRVKPEGDVWEGGPGSVVESDPDQGPSKSHVARDALGLGLVVVGMAILLHQLGVIAGIRWDIVWPVAIMLVGIIILVSSAIASRR